MWTDGCTKESKSRVSQRQKPKLDRWTTNIITRTESAGDIKKKKTPKNKTGCGQTNKSKTENQR